MTADIRAQIAAIQAEFATRPGGLVRHVQRVLVEALDLAARHDIDPDRTALAAWGHDLFRAEKPDSLLALARQAGVPIDVTDESDPVLLHGPVAAVILRERFAVSDDEALAAVRDHTLGLAEMPLIAKVILIADKVEERKRARTPIMREIRRLARRDLDTALLCWADWKWLEERTSGWKSHPTHWNARVEWVREHHVDAGLPGRLSQSEFERLP